MKNLKIFLTLFLFGIATNPALCAVDGLQKDNLNNIVDQGTFYKKCQGFNVGSDKPCIGSSKDKCYSKGNVSPAAGDEHGVLMMVARDTSVGGAQFCPTSVVARNKFGGDSWTEYYNAGDNCVWLCRPGFFGARCEQKNTVDVKTCDTTKLSQSDYDSVALVAANTTSNIEDSIPNFAANAYEKCHNNQKHIRDQEHDLILAISDWLPSGHGARVRAYMVLARQENYDNISWVDVYPAASIQNDTGSNVSSVLLCKNGYKPNSDKTDCIPIKAEVCGETNWCTGWIESNFDSSKHMKVAVGDCIQWRCKDSAAALQKSGSNVCEPCVVTQMDGINPKNGTCHHCEEGKVFSKKANSHCADTKYLDKNALMYGVGSKSSPVNKQCWTIINVEEYKTCVMGAAK